MFIVRIRKITQKKMRTTPQKKGSAATTIMCTPLTDAASSHMPAAVTIDAAFLTLDLLLQPALLQLVCDSKVALSPSAEASTSPVVIVSKIGNLFMPDLHPSRGPGAQRGRSGRGLVLRPGTTWV